MRDWFVLFSRIMDHASLSFITMPTTYSNIINGKSKSAGATFESRNPARWSELIGVFPCSSPADVDAAVRAARAAYAMWRSVPAPRRAEVLYRAAERLAREKEEFARLMTREMGK